jgi:hypothetical protein
MITQFAFLLAKTLLGTYLNGKLDTFTQYILQGFHSELLAVYSN